jgi:hypothetical protein
MSQESVLESLAAIRAGWRDGTPCIDPVLDGECFVTEALASGRQVSA